MLAALAACACDTGEHAARTIRDATVPAAESAATFDGVTREGTTLRHSWQLTTRLDWKRYSERVTAALDRQSPYLSQTPTLREFVQMSIAFARTR
jgi:hypothetical protein